METPTSVEINGEALYWKLHSPGPFLGSAAIPTATFYFVGMRLEDSSLKRWNGFRIKTHIY